MLAAAAVAAVCGVVARRLWMSPSAWISGICQRARPVPALPLREGRLRRHCSAALSKTPPHPGIPGSGRVQRARRRCRLCCRLCCCLTCRSRTAAVASCQQGAQDLQTLAARAPSHLHTLALSSSLTRALPKHPFSRTSCTHSPTHTRSLSLSLTRSRSQPGRTHSLPLARTVSLALSPVTKMQSLQEMHGRTEGPTGFFQCRGCDSPGTHSSLCRWVSGLPRQLLRPPSSHEARPQC